MMHIPLLMYEQQNIPSLKIAVVPCRGCGHPVSTNDIYLNIHHYHQCEQCENGSSQSV